MFFCYFCTVCYLSHLQIQVQNLVLLHKFQVTGFTRFLKKIHNQSNTGFPLPSLFLVFLLSSETCFCYAVRRLFVFFSPDVHFGSDLFTEQLDPGLLTPTPQTSGPFCHPKAPQYESGNSMKHIKTKSGAAGQIACDSSLHCPYSVPAQTDALALQRAPVDALGGYTEAAVSSTLPHLFPHGMDPYMFSKPGLDAGSGMFSCSFLFLQYDVFG